MQFPKKWQEISLDFISDPPLTRNRKESILAVVGRATKNTHLVLYGKNITESDAANLIWENIVELHGIPRTIYSDRGTQLALQFGAEMWKLTGGNIIFNTSYHPRTQGVVERMSIIVSHTLKTLFMERDKKKDWQQ